MTEPLRYYTDEHIETAVVIELRRRGIDILTTAEVGRAGRGISDADQLAYAATQGRVLVTRDRDFVELAATNIPHHGVILLQRALSIGDTITYLELTAHLATRDEMRDRLLFCDW